VNARANIHRFELAAQRSAFAPVLLVAYALGAALWAPVLAMFAEAFSGLLGWFLTGHPILDSAELLVIVWALRFTLYVFGANGGRNYGYGIGGVIVNRGLSLSEKARRIVTDWFGILLILIWIWFMWGVAAAALAE
jgi:hypothetical protein